jgi:hypothetical protein
MRILARLGHTIGIHSGKVWLPVFLVIPALMECRRDIGPVDVILLAGQSNAVGFDADPNLLPPDPRDRHVLFWWRCGDPPPDAHDSTSGGKWTYLQPQPKGNPLPVDQDTRQFGNFSHANGGFGPEIEFARTLADNDGHLVAIVKVAFSGTGIHTDWNPRDDGPSGACYRSLVTESRAAIRALSSRGLKPTLRAIAWVQGESDCNTKDAGLYEARMSEFITDLRADLGAPRLFVLMGLNDRFKGPDDPSTKIVVAAQKDVGRELAHCIYVETAGASLANRYHFDAAGNLDVGRRFALALIAAEDAKPSGKM